MKYTGQSHRKNNQISTNITFTRLVIMDKVNEMIRKLNNNNNNSSSSSSNNNNHNTNKVNGPEGITARAIQWITGVYI
eukprot:10905538-Heterocapsa_arctica.AAC.1